MADDEPTRDEIEKIVNDEPVEPVEAVTETITEEEVKPVAKAKTKAKAKPQIQITKETVESIKEEEVPAVEQKT